MKYTIDLLKLDIAKECSYLQKMISYDVAEDFMNDFADIIVKINHSIPITEAEKEKVLYIYNRYHDTMKIVTSDMIVYELCKEKL